MRITIIMFSIKIVVLLIFTISCITRHNIFTHTLIDERSGEEHSTAQRGAEDRAVDRTRTRLQQSVMERRREPQRSVGNICSADQMGEGKEKAN